MGRFIKWRGVYWKCSWHRTRDQILPVTRDVQTLPFSLFSGTSCRSILGVPGLQPTFWLRVAITIFLPTQQQGEIPPDPWPGFCCSVAGGSVFHADTLRACCEEWPGWVRKQSREWIRLWQTPLRGKRLGVQAPALISWSYQEDFFGLF